MRVLADTELSKFRKFAIVRRTYTGKNGQALTNEFVKHPGAAVILPLLADGRVVLIRNRRPVVNKELFELPAGTLDDGEEPAKAAARELTEETGYRAGKLESIVSFYSTPGICDEHMHAFLATDLREGQAQLEESEDIQTVLLTHEEMMKKARNGGIEDAKSLLTILFYDRFLRES